MTKKTTFMISTGASVVVVRDGKRQTIQAGGGAEFTDEEIASINRSSPGALRKPVNESRPVAADDSDEGSEDGAEKAAKPAKAAKATKPAKPAPDASDDADEDEDI